MSTPALSYAQGQTAKAVRTKTVPVNQAVVNAGAAASKVAEKGTNIVPPPKVKPEQSTMPAQKASPSTFRKGGKVRKTGFAKVHKGERVLTKSQARNRR